MCNVGSAVNKCSTFIHVFFTLIYITNWKTLSLLYRVSLDPKAQKLVGALRYFLSQFSLKYRKGSTADENPSEVLKMPLAQWVQIDICFHLLHHSLRRNPTSATTDSKITICSSWNRWNSCKMCSPVSIQTIILKKWSYLVCRQM